MKNKQKKDSILNEVKEGNGAKRNDHTPTPWKIYHEINIEAENGRHIGSFGVSPSFEESKRNTEFIVEAANSHEQLVANNERLESENARLVAENNEIKREEAALLDFRRDISFVLNTMNEHHKPEDLFELMRRALSRVDSALRPATGGK